MDCTVLIIGESGTGKEVVAELLHNESNRKDKPFIRLNSAAIPENLLESELFGYEKGSFTGANTSRIGKVEAANEGTLLLDEIGDMPLELQAKFLRVLENKKLTKIGSVEEIESDFRLISSTNKNLSKEVLKGNFRQDLYYRLNVVPIYISPLRERKEDIPILFDHYVKRISKELKKDIIGVSNDVRRELLNYSWPGNVRELNNVAERAVIFAKNGIIENVDILGFEKYIENKTYKDSKLVLDVSNLSFKEAVESYEEEFLSQALYENNWNITKTAEKISISRKHLHDKINIYKLRDRYAM